MFKIGDAVILDSKITPLDENYITICPTPYEGIIIGINNNGGGYLQVDYHITCRSGCNHTKWVYESLLMDYLYEDFKDKVKDRLG